MRKTALFYLLTVIFLTVLVAVPTRPISAEKFSNPALLQPGPWQDDNIRFERISNEQGLSMSAVLSIAQDRQGFLWIATQDGLNRYDGYTFKIFKHNPDDPGSLSANWITALLVDSNGILWAGTRGGGLNEFDSNSGRFLHFSSDPSNPRSLSSNVVNALMEDSAGGLWIGTDHGVDRMDLGSGVFLHLDEDPQAPDLLRSAVTRAIYQDHRGWIWIATSSGLVRYKPASGEFTVFGYDPGNPASLSNNNLSTVREDSAGRLWVATRGGGLDRMADDGQTFIHLRSSATQGADVPSTDGLSSDVIMDLYEDANGLLWIATWGGGLDRLDPHTGKLSWFMNEPENANSLGSNRLQTIFADSSGLIWIGTWGGGLSKFDPLSEQFLHYYDRPGDPNSLSANMVWAVLENAGSLWVGTVNGLDRLDSKSGQWSHYHHDPSDPNSLPSDFIYALFADRTGNVYASVESGGLSRFDPQNDRFINYTFNPPNLPMQSSATITAITQDDFGEIYVGSRYGISNFDPHTGEFTLFPDDSVNTTHPAPDFRINAILPGRDHGLWVGTQTGLQHFDPRTGEMKQVPIPAEAGGSDLSVQTIYEDSGGALWLGTAGSGLIYYQPDTGATKVYHEKDGLPNDTIYGILSDDTGCLWMSTNKGLAKFDPKSQDFITYDSRDGLQANEFNSNAYFRGASGEMFFGGINGLTGFVPGNIQSDTFQPPVVLTSLTQSGKVIDAGQTVESLQSVELHWPNNFFEFEAAALDYRQTDQNQYAYKLEGYDRDWVNSGAYRFGRYANLPGGKYTLRIKAANGDGIWNEAGIALRITVVPPFWQTWTFRGSLAFGLLALALVGFRVRVRGIENRNRQLRRLVEERTREIERRHEELQALYHADEELYRNIDLDDVLQALVDTAVHILNADKGALLVWDEKHERLAARATRGFKPETIPLLSFGPNEGVAGTVGVTGEPACVPNIDQADRASRQVTDPEGIQAFLQVPVKVGGKIFGVFSADYLTPRAIGEAELDTLSSLAERAALAIQNAQIFEQSQAQAVVEERSRLARELHDAVTQTLFSASLLAEALPGAYENDPEEGRALLDELRQLSRGALAEMRTLLMELRPSALGEANMDELLHQLGEAAAGREGIPVKVTVDNPCPLPPDVHVTLYRIAQEALNNAVKHSRATEIAIKLDHLPTNGHGCQSDTIRLCIQDNGRGFDPTNIPSNHLGLGIMRERAESIGAQLSLDSQPGNGTTIRVIWEPGPNGVAETPAAGNGKANGRL